MHQIHCNYFYKKFSNMILPDRLISLDSKDCLRLIEIVKGDDLVKNQISRNPVIPAQVGDSIDFDPVISIRSGFPPARE